MPLSKFHIIKLSRLKLSLFQTLEIRLKKLACEFFLQETRMSFLFDADLERWGEESVEERVYARIAISQHVRPNLKENQ